MFDWIYSNREVFLSTYVDIGRNHAAAAKLQEEHNQFTVASNVSDLNINNFRLLHFGLHLDYLKPPSPGCEH